MFKLTSLHAAVREARCAGLEPLAPDLVTGAIRLPHETQYMCGGGRWTAAVALSAVLSSLVGTDLSGQPDINAAPLTPTAAAQSVPFDPMRFKLNAPHVPAVDGDVVPLRWIDPRPSARLGTAAQVRENERPLLPGTPTPDSPLQLNWLTGGCLPAAALE